MNCDAARRRLLAEERPDQPADDVRRHLAACPACRALSRRLTLLERQIPRLPVPPSSAKSAFLRRFVRTGGPVVRRLPLPWPTPVKERGLKKLSLAVAIAAVLAVFTLAWWSWPHVASAPTHPAPAWVAEIRTERAAIRKMPNAGDRVARTGTLAMKLRQQAAALTRAGDADGLTSLAAEYVEVVRKDLLDHANAVPAAQREAALDAAMTELMRANSQFLENATAGAGTPTARPLRQMADAAGDGLQRLRVLLKAA